MRTLRNLLSLLPLVALSLIGCNDGTYMVLQISSQQPLTNLDHVELQMSLGGRMQTSELREKSGQSLSLPTSATIEITSGEGSFSVLAIAYDAANHELARGTGSGNVRAESSVTIPVVLREAGGGSDGGTDGGSGTDGGNPVVAVLTADKPAYDLGTIVVQSTTPVTIGISNSGQATSGTLTTTIGGSDASLVTIGSDGCAGQTLVAGGHCSITLQVAPTQAGSLAAMVSVSGTPGNTATTALTATVVAAGSLRLMPASHDFMSVMLGAAADFGFSAQNSGGSASSALTVSISGSDADQFSITQDNCSSKTLDVGASCSFNVHFAPSKGGAKSASLTVSATAGGTAAANLTGTALAPASLAWTPTAKDFGLVDDGQSSAAQTFTLANSGDSDSSVVTLAQLGSGAASFALSSDTCTGNVVTAHSSCSVAVTFTPQGDGMQSATLSASATSGATPAVNATLTGNARASFVLGVTPAGSGSGTVTSSTGTPGSINCGTTCSSSFYDGQSVTLSAVAAAHSSFTGWSVSDGTSCPGTGPCTVVMSAAKTVTATFTKDQVTLTVSVTSIDSGVASVTSTPAGISNCSNSGTATQTCSGSFDYGTTVTFTATPTLSSAVQSWSGCTTAKGATCTFAATAAGTVTATIYSHSNNIAFVTSTRYAPGALGGISGANAKCQGAAVAGGLGGTYNAWLATTTASAGADLGSGGFFRPDFKVVAFTTHYLELGTIYYPINVNEFGQPLSEDGSTHFAVATGAKPDGSLDGTSNCSNWTSTTGTVTAGSAQATTAGWTQLYGESCASQLPIYCFSNDFTDAVSEPLPTGERIAFVSSPSTLWTPSSGRAAADTICANNATTAGLTGTFRAFVATETSPAADSTRFDFTGNSWYRPDGTQLAANAAAFNVAQPQLWAPINQVASSSTQLSAWVYDGLVDVYLGATDAVSTGTAATTCGNWTTGTGTANGLVASTTPADPFQHFGATVLQCAPGPVICLQSKN